MQDNMDVLAYETKRDCGQVTTEECSVAILGNGKKKCRCCRHGRSR